MRLKNIIGLLLVFWVIMPSTVSAQPWSGITEVTLNDIGEDFSPQIAVYNGKLYVVWYTNTTSNSEDTDIVIKCFDGISWGNIIEVTLSDDTGNDFAPRLMVYDDKLYVVWQTLDDAISGGSDMDIVIRYYDSKIGDINNTNAWSEITELTPPMDDCNDYNPHLCVYVDKLYAVWETVNPSITTGEDRDIVIKSYDGNFWSEWKEVTLQGDSYDDMYPYLCVYQGKLWAVWQTQNDSAGNIDEDILVRHYDSFTDVWSDVSEITQNNDDTINDCTEDKYPIMTVYNERLYVLWQRTEHLEDTTGDSDLVMKNYNGEIWGNIIEITPGDSADDGGKFKYGFDFTGYNNKLYIIWQSQSGGVGVDWDIFVKSYDGEMFGYAAELTLPSDFESDDYPCLAVYNGRLYATWQTRDNTTSSGADSDIVVRSITIQTENILGHEVEIAYGDIGTLNVEETAKPDELPEGLTDIGIVINVIGSVANVQITIRYNEDDVPEKYSEASIKMYYWNGTDWNKIEDSGVDMVNNIVWANVSHFTIFAPAAAKVSQSVGSPWYLEPDVGRALILLASVIIVLVVVIQVLIYRMTLHGKDKNKLRTREERIKARRKARKRKKQKLL